MNEGDHFYFLRRSGDLSKCFFSFLIITCQNQGVGFLYKSSIHNLLRLICLSDEVHFLVIDVQTVFVVSVDLKESSLPVYFVHEVFKKIIVSGEVKLLFIHFKSEFFILSFDIILGQHSITELSVEVFGYFLNQEDVIDVDDDLVVVDGKTEIEVLRSFSAIHDARKLYVLI